MKKKLMLLFIIPVMLMNGCFSYKDINRVLFVTSVMVDIDKDKNPVLYLEAFKPFRSTDKGSEKGQRITFRATGKTVFEAIRDANLSSSYKLNYTQNKAVIFTQKAAEYGIDNFIDFFDRGQEALSRPYVAVYVGDPEALMKAKIKEEDYIGEFLVQLFNNQGTASRTVKLPLYEYLNCRNSGDKVCVVTAIQIKKDQPEEKLEVNGGAVIKEDKLVKMISRADGEKYNFLVNNVKSGSLEEANPLHKDRFVSLEILNSKTKTSLKYDGKKIYLKKIINVKTSFAEADKSIILNNDTINQIQREAEQSIMVQCSDLFNRYKSQHIDIFGVTDKFQEQYPNENVKDIIDITELDMEVHVKLNDSMDIKDYLQ